MKPFLTADWRDLVLVNFAVESEILKEYIPPGTELDYFEGKCYVSLVAFKFLNTRILGIKVPRHDNFVEINLRFYVLRKELNEVRRGVTFLKEIVPKELVSQVARRVYGEPYETWNAAVSVKKDELLYSWKKNDCDNMVRILPGDSVAEPLAESFDEFITEHYWGYTKRGESRTDEYQVTHPKWDHSPVIDFEIKVDFKRCYGEKWAFLDYALPASILFSRGSEVIVFPGNKLLV